MTHKFNLIIALLSFLNGIVFLLNKTYLEKATFLSN